jgi:glycosyltransferase involved in cell wall biosynthesis
VVGVRLAFVLPGFSDVPSGGYRVAFEYANRLSARGHEVTLLCPAVRRIRQPERAVAAGLIAPWWSARQRGHLQSRPSWFALRPQVLLHRPVRLRARQLTCFDAVLATQWDTAEDLARLLPAGVAGLQLIQSYETWHGPVERVDAVWRSGLTVLVIARWLAELGQQLTDAPMHLVPNAVDTEVFTPQPVARDPHLVAMLWHADRVKGSDVGARALLAAREQLADLQAEVFGTGPRPEGLPLWCSYVQRPTTVQLVGLLSRASVFLAPSRLEGWALPPAEAMACGCAVVATDIGGHRDYCRDGETALLANPEDAAGLAAALVGLLRDPALSRTLAAAGQQLIRGSFGWEDSTAALEGVIAGAVRSARPD